MVRVNQGPNILDRTWSIRGPGHSHINRVALRSAWPTMSHVRDDMPVDSPIIETLGTTTRLETGRVRTLNTFAVTVSARR